MNILQQIWTDSNVFSICLVNLLHAVTLVPVIDHDVVAVGETVQFFCRLIRKRRSNCRCGRVGRPVGECRSQNRLRLTYVYQLVIGLCKFAQNFNNDCSKKRNSDRSLSTTRPNSLKRYLDFVLSITSY